MCHHREITLEVISHCNVVGPKGQKEVRQKERHGNSRRPGTGGYRPLDRTLVAKLDKEGSLNNVAVAEVKGSLILATRASRTRLICQSNRLFGLVYSVEVDCQNLRSDTHTMSEYKREQY